MVRYALSMAHPLALPPCRGGRVKLGLTCARFLLPPQWRILGRARADGCRDRGRHFLAHGFRVFALFFGSEFPPFLPLEAPLFVGVAAVALLVLEVWREVDAISDQAGLLFALAAEHARMEIVLVYVLVLQQVSVLTELAFGIVLRPWRKIGQSRCLFQP